MKKGMGIVVLLFLIFVFYTDLSNGTITSQTEKEIESGQHIEAIAKPGDTLISLLGRYDLLPPSANIDDLSREFSNLNNGMAPHDMVAGERYLLPNPE